MAQMTLEYDDETDALLEDLKKFFGVKTKAAVLRRALVIAKAAKKYADEDKSVKFEKPDGSTSETFMIGS